MDSVQLDTGVTSVPLVFIIGIGGGKEGGRRGNMVVKDWVVNQWYSISIVLGTLKKKKKQRSLVFLGSIHWARELLGSYEKDSQVDEQTPWIAMYTWAFPVCSAYVWHDKKVDKSDGNPVGKVITEML